jgi:hypothetical protein
MKSSPIGKNIQRWLPRACHNVGSGVSASAVQEGGHRHDRWEAEDPKTEKTVVIFFNADDEATPASSRRIASDNVS